LSVKIRHPRSLLLFIDERKERKKNRFYFLHFCKGYGMTRDDHLYGVVVYDLWFLPPIRCLCSHLVFRPSMLRIFLSFIGMKRDGETEQREKKGSKECKIETQQTYLSWPSTVTWHHHWWIISMWVASIFKNDAWEISLLISILDFSIDRE
jgi:hypothetical protein